jgi:hypothetical protein
MGEDRSRRQTERAALEAAKRNAIEQILVNSAIHGYFLLYSPAKWKYSRRFFRLKINHYNP